MTREQLIQNVNSGVYNSKVLYPKESKKSKYYVFDRTKSVEWNEEKLKDYNRQIDEMRRNYSESVTEGHRLFKQDCIEYLVSILSIDRNYGEKVFDAAYEKGHANGHIEVLSELDDYIRILQPIVGRDI